MSNNYNVIRIQQYLNGELSQEEMYRLERDALEDPFLQEALDGYREASRVDHRQLSILQRRLANRIALKQEKRDTFYFGAQRLAIAATACVLFVLVCVLFWMRMPVKPAPVAKEVEVELSTLGAIIGVTAEPILAQGLDAQPQYGWEAYNEYLAANKQADTGDGKVVLVFDVDRQGRPVNIREEGGEVDRRLIAEATRLLSEGPDWSGSKGKIAVAFTK